MPLPSETRTVLRMNSYLVILGLLITCLASGKMGRGEESWDRRERVRAETRNDFGLPSTQLTVYIGLGAATVRIRAYRATGEVDVQEITIETRLLLEKWTMHLKTMQNNAKVAITQGTKLLLTCDATGLHEDSEVVSYRWYHSLTGSSQDI